jgi:hypothetical protein
VLPQAASKGRVGMLGGKPVIGLLQILLMVALPVAAGGYAAWFLRRRLSAMRWNIYAFSLMIGLLTPLLISLLIARVMIEFGEAGPPVVFAMIIGISVGTGWLVGALMFRFNGEGE